MLTVAEKQKKINGERNQFHIVKQDEFPVYDGIHEAIVSEEDWLLAQKERKESGTKYEKVYNLEHEHLLSGILKCPVCGGRMYGNVNRKKKPDRTIYSGKNVYHFLYSYGIMYKEFTDVEKKRFLNEFLESVELFPETQPDGKILKSITARFPVVYDGDNVTEIRWDKNITVETDV